MKQTNILISIFALTAILLLPSCKPTEKNYQAAYDVAQKKKQAEKTDPDMAIPSTGLQRLDAPSQKEVNGDKVNVKHLFIKYVGKGESPEILRYNVAVAKYKMPTNALAQTEDLTQQKYKAFPVEGTDGCFYVIASTFSSLDEAAAFAKEYLKKHKPEQLVGLDGSPLIIQH